MFLLAHKIKLSLKMSKYFFCTENGGTCAKHLSRFGKIAEKCAFFNKGDKCFAQVPPYLKLIKANTKIEIYILLLVLYYCSFFNGHS